MNLIKNSNLIRRGIARPAFAVLVGIATLATLATPGLASTRLVATTGSDSGNCIGTPCLTMAYAIGQAAASGDTISVAAGLYNLSTGITVNKSVVLQGPKMGIDPRPSAATTRTVGSAAEAIVDAASGLATIFAIQANDVVIDGFELRNTTGALIDTSLGSTFSNAQVRYNILHHSTSGKGIRFQQITSGIVEYNHLFDVQDAGVEIGSGSSANSTNAIVRYNEIHDLGSGSTTNSALYAFSASFSDINVTFQGNLIYNFAGNDAIKVGAKNGQDRARIGGSVLDNVVHDVAEDGITINASNTLVQGNEVYGCFSTNGVVYAEHSNASVTIENNNLHDNAPGKAAILIGDNVAPSPTGFVVRQNRLDGNSNNILLFRDVTGGVATVDASANWWGAFDQPTVSSRVQSTVNFSTPTTNRIDFTPWINSGTDTAPATTGFQPDLSSLTVAPATISLQTGAPERIQEAVDLADAPAVVTVLSGSYAENFTAAADVEVNLVAAGTVVSGTGDLSANATLSGIGTLTGAVSVGSGGHVSPGNGIGILNVGSVGFVSGASLDVDITGTTVGTGYDQLNVAGAVSLGGATLQLSMPFVSASSDSFMLISNGSGSPVTGTFNGLSEGATFPLNARLLQISYVGGDGNDVVLSDVGSQPFTPTMTPTYTPTRTPTITPTITNSPTFTATPTVTPTPTATTLAACAATPISGCRNADRSVFKVVAKSDPAKSTVGWRFRQHADADLSDLGDPINGATDYRLCVYDEMGGVPELVLGSRAAAGAICTHNRSCWRKKPFGLSYRNSAATPDGLAHFSVMVSPREYTTIHVTGRKHVAIPTAATPDALFSQDPNLTVQLVTSNGPVCWEAIYAAAGYATNTTQVFRDKTP